MPPKVRKPEFNPGPSGRIHATRRLPDNLLRFSFKHFSDNGKFGFCRATEGYAACLFGRLKDLSSMTPMELHANRSDTLRCHPIDWRDTTEQDGFSHLNEQLRDLPPIQFSLSANAHGRVHGFLIDEVFYVVWLDPAHALYA